MTFFSLGTFFHLGRFVLGTFCPWDVLFLGTFCFWDLMSWDVLSLGRFVSWDVLFLGPYVLERFVPGTFCFLERFVSGTLCLGTFCPFGRFVCVPSSPLILQDLVLAASSPLFTVAGVLYCSACVLAIVLLCSRVPGPVYRLFRPLCCRPGPGEGGGHAAQRQRREAGDLRGPAGPPQDGAGLYAAGDGAPGLRHSTRVHGCLHTV